MYCFWGGIGRGRRMQVWSQKGNMKHPRGVETVHILTVVLDV